MIKREGGVDREGERRGIWLVAKGMAIYWLK